MDNPFDTPAQPETNNTDTKEKTMTEIQNTENGVSLTYKGGAGFDAPWIVIRSETVEGALEQASNPALKELMEVVQLGGQHFAGLAKPTTASNGRAPRQGQPPASTSVEITDADWSKIEQRFGSREIPAGWESRSGVSKNTGKPWRAIMPPRGSDEKPLFL